MCKQSKKFIYFAPLGACHMAQPRADQHQGGAPIRECPYPAEPAAALTVQPLDHVVGVDARPVFAGKVTVSGLLQRSLHQGKAKGLAACASQTASPFAIFAENICLTFRGHFKTPGHFYRSLSCGYGTSCPQAGHSISLIFTGRPSFMDFVAAAAIRMGARPSSPVTCVSVPLMTASAKACCSAAKAMV